MTTKSFDIPKALVLQAYKLVKANAGAAGVDRESLDDFEKDRRDNLYKIWNRMSSGSYLPPPVKAVAIPKKQGGMRILGVPTVADRIAQAVVKLVFEPIIEPVFLEDSYGYRPNKSALDAVEVTRKRCWRYDWVLEYDIVGLFDNIPHDLLMKAVHKHTNCRWVILYIERWLKAPMQETDGKLVERTCGTPQGGVISPVLSNLFLHYVFDVWMERNHANKPWCRYADDGLIHCKTKMGADKILEALRLRFAECGLALHPDKTKIVYCKDDMRKGNHAEMKFDFLGFTFRRRLVMNSKTRVSFVGFTPSVSNHSLKSMRSRIRKLGWRNRTEFSLSDIAKALNPTLQGWMNYYGSYNRSGMYSVWRHFNKTLVAWAMKKFKGFGRSSTKAGKFLQAIAKKSPRLFAHWRAGMVGSFV